MLISSKKKLLLITTTHLAKNPRLVKEVETLHLIYDISVVFFQILPQYVPFDEKITHKYPTVKFHSINWLHKFYPCRFFYTLIQKLLIIYWRVTGCFLFPEQQFFPGYFMLLRKCKQISFDMIHGHNPGAWGVVVKCALQKKVVSSFDLEDFHRGEYSENNSQRKLLIHLEEKYYKKTDLLCAASPLIATAYENLFQKKTKVINNVFPSTEFKKRIANNLTSPLKLVWFSQMIGPDRGLNELIKGLNLLDFKVELSLYGEGEETYKNYLKQELKAIHTISFKGLVTNQELNMSLSSYDVGIASEMGHIENRKFCLTNKVFAYIQAGLSILASDTEAQIALLKKFPDLGHVYEKNSASEIALILQQLHENRLLLMAQQEKAYETGQDVLCWEKESAHLVNHFETGLKTISHFKKLNIAITVDPEIPVPPTLYGGIERIVYLLVEELCLRGHHVTLFAHRDSKTSAKLIPWYGKSSPSLFSTIKNSFQLWQNFRKMQFDVVHSFSRLAYLSLILDNKVTKLMSYQREPTLSQIKKAKFFGKKGSIIFTGCSDYIANQIRDIAPTITIHNGVNLSKYHFKEEIKEDAPLIFLGRIEAIKGTHLAIELAKRTKKKLIIAGNVPLAGQSYYQEKIAPFLDENIIYLGEVNDTQKNELLGSAAALIMPIQWNEPFGIVMIEAMACGTPVIGFKRGSLAEIVIHEENGFICDDLPEMIYAVEKISSIKRLKVRKYVEKYFSAEVITDQYLRAYHQPS